MLERTLLLALAGLALLLSPNNAFAQAAPAIHDIFDRDITTRGLTLIDWQGYMANPAIEFQVIPPPGAKAPFQLTVAATEPRLYFNLPSSAAATGPRKEIRSNASTLSMSVSIFPAREKKRIDTTLVLDLSDARSQHWHLILPVHVIITETEPHAADLPPDTFPVIVDFSQDKSDFFKNEAARKVFQQAVSDWAFYLAPLPVSPVPVNAETTWIYRTTGFSSADSITNANAYTGFLLYTYGINGPEHRSGGAPSRDGDFQQSNGKPLPLHRSGTVEVAIHGNYNQLGYNFALPDNEWFKAMKGKNAQDDFYSIVHHEIGHALFFMPNNPRWVRNGVLPNDVIRDYLGKYPRTDPTDHFANTLDPVSLHGAFGNEYYGNTPPGRWLITKLDLLAAFAVGYKLRPVDALIPLTIDTAQLPNPTLNQPYTAALRARGGVPFYDWTLANGKLPDGLTLDRFSGEISGTPTRPGKATFAIQVREYAKGTKPLLKPMTLTVGPPG